MHYSSEDHVNSHADDGRNKIKVKKKVEKVVRTEIDDVDIQGLAVNTTRTQEIPVNNQIVVSRDKIANKRKTVKGLKARIPAKIQKNNRGEKRLLHPDWEESQRKKNKKYNVARIELNYDLWNL